MVAIDDLAGLLSLVQAGTVEIHPWGSRVDHLSEPDRFDFRSRSRRGRALVCRHRGGARGARASRRPRPAIASSRPRVARGSMSSSPSNRGRLGGGESLYLVGGQGHGESAARSLCRHGIDSVYEVGAFSSIICATIADRPRLPAYSTRALPQASVSTPLAWEELSEGLRSDHFTVANLRNRLRTLKRDPWHALFKIRQRIPVNDELSACPARPNTFASR